MSFPDYTSLPQYANILHLYKLDEESGTRSDFIASCDLADANTVLYGSGKIGNGADFELDNSEYLIATAVASADMNFTDSNFSISFWVKQESLPTGSNSLVWLSRGNYNADGYYIQYEAVSDQINITVNQSGEIQVTKSTTGQLSTGTWIHFVFIRNGTTAYIYKNGSDISLTQPTLTDPVSSSRALSLGAYYLTDHFDLFIDGLMDELIVWDVALSSAEVSTLYNWYSKAGFSGAISFSGSIIKKPKKTLTGAISFTGVLSRKAKKLLEGAITFVGTLQKLPKKVLTGVILFSGVLSKNFKKILTGSISFTGTLSTKVKKTLTGAISFIGQIFSPYLDGIWSLFIKRTTSWTEKSKETTTWTAQDKEDTDWTTT